MGPVPGESERSPRLADRLQRARQGRFVGRATELDLFRSALLAAEPRFAVLHIYGPGGVGKTTLLREFARLAAESGRPVVHLDGRNIDPSPRGFLLALRRTLGLQDEESAVIPECPPGAVWLIDTHEMLAPLDAWLRETLLPNLPARSLVVLAGRNPPAPDWRTDLDWAALTEALALPNLRPEESQTYLATRGIPEEHHPEVLTFTRGHPLALALVADALNRGETLTTFDPRTEPDVIRVLLDRLVREVPTPAHRLALEACVLARATTETLLADVVGRAEAHDLFAWLRQQSFIEHGPYGLFPHDLARDVLDTDLRWRDPRSYQELHERVLSHLRSRWVQTSGLDQQRLRLDILFVNRHHPGMKAFFAWDALDSAYAEPASAADAPAILAMVRAHEGDASGEIAAYWLHRHPQAFSVFRGRDGALIGFMANLPLHEATSDDVAADPAVAAALRFAEQHGPVRPGEEIVHLRFWMGCDTYQAVSPAINLTAINSVNYWMTHPKLAWNFITMAEPEFWQPHFASINMWRSPEADFEVDGQRFSVFSHDWRVEPAAQWGIGPSLPTSEPARSLPSMDGSPPTAVLCEADFGAAVRQALRDFTRLDQLATNPLVHSRLVVDAMQQDSAPRTLQALLRGAIAALQTNPKDAKLHRALWHTYVEPAPTQELAAELLGLPFNTYRYHLAKGIERVINTLWRRELNGSPLDPL